MLTPKSISDDANFRVKEYEYQPNYGIINYGGIKLVWPEDVASNEMFQKIIKDARFRVLTKKWPSGRLNVRFIYSKESFASATVSTNGETALDLTLESLRNELLDKHVTLALIDDPNIKRNIQIITNVELTPDKRILIDVNEEMMQCFIGFYHARLSELLTAFNSLPLVYSCKYTNNVLKVMLPLLFAPWDSLAYSAIRRENCFDVAVGIQPGSYLSTSIYDLIERVQHDINWYTPFDFVFEEKAWLNPRISLSDKLYNSDKWEGLRSIMDA